MIWKNSIHFQKRVSDCCHIILALYERRCDKKLLLFNIWVLECRTWKPLISEASPGISHLRLFLKNSYFLRQRYFAEIQPKLLITCPLTCDGTGKGVAHSNGGEGGRGSSPEGRNNRGGATKRGEPRCAVVVAIGGALERRWLSHLGGVWSVKAHVWTRGGMRRIWAVLLGGTLVLFTLDTAHSQACGERS